jgi:hypothetical protein
MKYSSRRGRASGRGLVRARSAGKPVVEALEERQLMSLTIALRAADGSTSVNSVTVGEVLNLQIDAIITGPAAEDSINYATGSILSTAQYSNAVAGNLAATVNSRFQSSTFDNGTRVDLNGDGNIDVGSNDGTNIAGYFFALTEATSSETVVSEGRSEISKGISLQAGPKAEPRRLTKPVRF